MDNNLKSIRDLIEIWQHTPVGMKRGAMIALSEDLGIPVGSVRAMKCRGSIAKKHWPKLTASARRHAQTSIQAALFAKVSAELLLDLSFATVDEPTKFDKQPAGIAA